MQGRGKYDHVVWCQRRDEQWHSVLFAVVEGSTEAVPRAQHCTNKKQDGY